MSRILLNFIFNSWAIALGLRTLVGTGSRSTAFKELPASLFFRHNSKNINKLANASIDKLS